MEMNEIKGITDDHTDLKTKKVKLQQEFLKFLKGHTVYETIPENMKVNSK